MKIENVVVISLSDHEEYQELKKKPVKKEIDFSRLKTGSKIKVKFTGQFCNGGIDYNDICDVVLVDTKYFIHKGLFCDSNRDGVKYICLHQNGKYATFSFEKDNSYITEVIEY